MANVYETWGHYAATKLCTIPSGYFNPVRSGVCKGGCWKTGTVYRREKRIYEFRAFDAERTDKELNAPSGGAIDKFPADNHDWVYRLGLCTL